MGINSKEYDKMASEVFLPIYPDIAAQIVERTGVRSGALLDLGCGGGHLGFAVMELGTFQTTFCDISDEMLELTRKRGDELGREFICTQGDVHHLPFRSESFDLVVSRGSMPFWTDQKKAFSEIFRVLRPGGRAYIGGGLGGEQHRKRIMEQIEGGSEGFRCFDTKNSLALATEEYVRLFEELGASYTVYEKNGEGRWFLFGKEERQ